jgi:hypothetical protein
MQIENINYMWRELLMLLINMLLINMLLMTFCYKRQCEPNSLHIYSFAFVVSDVKFIST